ncbi:MAG: DEAD/DEAH box helicase [Tepidisphaeraceae bacterium]
MQFADLRLAEPILRSLVEEGYATATPIQAKAIPLVLEGRDVLGCAQTGTGKTAAFALPILHRFSEHPAPAGKHPIRCLVLCPTRELALQISDGFRAYGRHLKLRTTVIFGGVGQNPQVDALRRGVDVCIATPGRLLDLMNQGYVDLKGVEVLVLDEADRMLDMGFIHDIRKVVAKLPAKRQTLLFSATMPTEIRKLADALMHNPASVEVARVSSTADNIEERVYFVEKSDKAALLAHLYEELPLTRAIVFTRTKHGADKVVKQLMRYNIQAEAIHGNKSQNARQRALNNFKIGKTPLLIATDIASRGIDVDEVGHVVNYDLTHEPETYVHRIGRTARAGASGMAVSFCDREERSHLRDIEKLIKRKVPVAEATGFAPKAPQKAESTSERPARAHGGPNGITPRPTPTRDQQGGQRAPQDGHRPQREDRGGHRAARDERPTQGHSRSYPSDFGQPSARRGRADAPSEPAAPAGR